MSLISILLTLLILAANWMTYKKMGRQGWEAIVPIYNGYALCETLYGNGWKFFLLLIPIYNIYFAIKMDIDLAHAFNKSTGFGIGLIFLSFIFLPMLGFGNAQYGDGSRANTESDFVSNAVEGAAGAMRKDDAALEKLAQLNELKNNGVLTEEEYLAKKEELLKRV